MDASAQLQTLIAAGAWIQPAASGSFLDKIALGAATWIESHGILFAELGAEHQGHVHLIEAARLDLDGPEMVDAYDAAGGLVATIHAMNVEEVAAYRPAAWHARIEAKTEAGDTWRQFWASQIKHYSA